MENNSEMNERKVGKRKITWLIVMLTIIIVAFIVGAIFCAPWSPVHKALNESRNLLSTYVCNL